jgi:hypothetical protein
MSRRWTIDDLVKTGIIAMTSFAQTIALPEIRARPRRRRNAAKAWSSLFFGPGPMWWRLVRWGQRNAAD